MPASLLNEIASYHWPVAKGDGYPSVMLIEPDLVLDPPNLADLGRLEGVAACLGAADRRHPGSDPPLAGP